MSIYFVSNSDGHIKIGYAVDVPRRVATIATGFRDGLVLLAVIEKAGIEAEKALHREFSKDRLEGEWFSSSASIQAAMRPFLLENKKIIGGEQAPKKAPYQAYPEDRNDVEITQSIMRKIALLLGKRDTAGRSIEKIYVLAKV